MYEEYFNLSGSPFKLNPDPKFFFGSRSHNKAMAYLNYGLKQAEGFIVITGPIGSGKTMVIGQLLDQLNASNVIAAQLLTSNIAPEELLDHILSSFRIEPEGEGRTGKLEAFEDYLFDQLNRGRRVLLIVDEAQNLPFETLEELRMLSNIDYDGTPLFQAFLVGQPEFRETLQSARLEQLRQRVIASYHLENLTLEETKEYILHRLSVAGWAEKPSFMQAAFERIFAETGGRPRRINTVCNRIMLYCAIEEKHEVSSEIADIVIEELKDEELEARDVVKSNEEAKPVSETMPPVRSLDKEDQERLISDDDVVVSIESARARGAAAFEASQKSAAKQAVSEEAAVGAEQNSGSASLNEGGEAMETTEEKTEDKPDTPPAAEEAVDHEGRVDASSTGQSAPASPPLVANIGGSVFDRLRAQRDDSQSDLAEDRSEATLEEVATAIANARIGESVEIEDSVDQSDAGVGDPAIAGATRIAPLKSVQSKEWRRQVRHSIDETRDELKAAHDSVRKLRKSLTDMQRRRQSNREKIVSSIQRAEDLLSDLRKSWP